MNRGKARLWIEGDSLQSMGWTRGKRFNVTFGNGAIIIEAITNGKRKIAGTESRPIIDINTDKLRQCLGQCESVQVIIQSNIIAITGIK